MNDWHSIHITDKTGKKFFNTTASPMAAMSEIRNMKRHLEAIKCQNKGYEKVGVDPSTATLMLDGSPYLSVDEILGSELLDDLFS